MKEIYGNKTIYIGLIFYYIIYKYQIRFLDEEVKTIFCGWGFNHMKISQST